MQYQVQEATQRLSTMPSTDLTQHGRQLAHRCTKVALKAVHREVLKMQVLVLDSKAILMQVPAASRLKVTISRMKTFRMQTLKKLSKTDNR